MKFNYIFNHIPRPILSWTGSNKSWSDGSSGFSFNQATTGIESGTGGIALDGALTGFKSGTFKGISFPFAARPGFNFQVSTQVNAWFSDANFCQLYIAVHDVSNSATALTSDNVYAFYPVKVECTSDVNGLHVTSDGVVQIEYDGVVPDPDFRISLCVWTDCANDASIYGSFQARVNDVEPQSFNPNK